MNFSSFLQEASCSTFWEKSPNICFRSDDFNPLFFNNLFSHLEKNSLLPYSKIRIDLTTTDKNALLATLNQSILGNCVVFWLSNINPEESKKDKSKDLIPHLLSYQGPHFIIYYLSKESKFEPGKMATIIDVPSTIEHEAFSQLIAFFKQNTQHKKNIFLGKIFKQTKTIQLDTACMLINYLDLISVKNPGDLDYYLNHITQNQPSLNQLSEYFFSANAQNFFSIWSKIEKVYPEMFWISFWSEQLWKAHHIITYLKKNDFVNAKRMSFRLPYSFINTYWKKFSPKELRLLYNHLYLIDTKIKRGSSSESALNFFFFSYFFEKSRVNYRMGII